MAKFEQDIPSEDWMKCTPATFGAAAAQAWEAIQAHRAGEAPLMAQFELEVAKTLVERNQLPQGRAPIFNRWKSAIADPSKHSKAATEAGKKGKAKEFTLAPLYNADKTPKTADPAPAADPAPQGKGRR